MGTKLKVDTWGLIRSTLFKLQRLYDSGNPEKGAYYIGRQKIWNVWHVTSEDESQLKDAVGTKTRVDSTDGKTVDLSSGTLTCTNDNWTVDWKL